VKAVTGFARFQFQLKPQEEFRFDVEEEASYLVELRLPSDLVNFITRRAQNLMESNVLDKETLGVLKYVVKKSQFKLALQVIEAETYTEKDLLTWKAPLSIDPESGTIIPTILLEKVAKVLNLQLREKEITQIIDSRNEYISKVFQNQSRLRENIKSMEKMRDSELVKRYLKDLDKEEDDLMKTRESIENFEKEKIQVQKELKDIRYEAVREAGKLRENL